MSENNNSPLKQQAFGYVTPDLDKLEEQEKSKVAHPY